LDYGHPLCLQASGATSSALAPPDVRAGRQVYHFLAEQVFEQQSPEIRAFLLNSALLQEVTPETCDSVFARNDSGQMLATLLHKHLFITEIKPGVLRYHPLFREFLHEQYRTSDPQGYRSMGHRVADMYLAQEQWPLAFDIYCAIGDLPAAQQVISVGGNRLYTLGRADTLSTGSPPCLGRLDAPLLCLKARVCWIAPSMEARVLTDLAKARMHPGEEPIALLLRGAAGPHRGHLRTGARPRAACSLDDR
jgi:hypothetical protein